MTALITQEEMDATEGDDQQRFVAIEAKCRERLDNICAGENEWALVTDARHRYLATVFGVAQAFEISPVCEWDLPTRSEWTNENFDDFVVKMTSITAQLMAHHSRRTQENSISLKGDTKDRLYSLAQHMREHIDKLSISSSRKIKLKGLLDDFEKNIEKPRLSILLVGNLCLFAASVIADLDGSGRAVRDALSKIEQIVGAEKFEQDEARQKLMPQKPVAPLLKPVRPNKEPEHKRQISKQTTMSDAIDDDIPF